MNAFEFVFGLVSIIASLGLTHLVATSVALLRHRGGVTFSWLQATWIWSAFMLTIGNWGSQWSVRGLASWSSGLVLVTLFMAVGQYAFCVLVSPELPAEGRVDLVAFHAREHRRYAIALAVLGVLALAQNLMLASGNAYADWMRDSLASIAVIVLGGVAALVEARWAQWLAALMVAALSTYLVVLTCNIVAP